MIQILIADNQILTREGIKQILSEIPDLSITGQAENFNELKNLMITINPHVVIIDPNFLSHFNLNDVKQIHLQFPNSRLLILTDMQSREELRDLIEHGINNHLHKKCNGDDLVKAVYATAKGDQYFCERTKMLMTGGLTGPDELPALSIRETEIIQFIAAGMTNKEIAERLFLSIHTIKTHRKNIIKKLGFSFKNAADLMNYTSTLS